MSGILGSSIITIKHNGEIKEIQIKDFVKIVDSDPSSISQYQIKSEGQFYSMLSYKRADFERCASASKKIECSYDCKILITKDPHKYCEAKHLVGHAILKDSKKITISKLEDIGSRCTYLLQINSPNKSFSVNGGYEILGH